MNQQYENQVDGLRRGVGENGEDQDGDLETDSDFVDDSDMMANIEPNLRTLPDKYLGQIIHVLQNLPNETVDIGTPHLRKSLEDVYPLFLVLYGVVMVAGALGNIGMAGHILRRRLYRDSTGAYLLNIAFCNVLMVVVLLPLSLAILLIQNWVFGSFLCYFVPMLQDVPLHVTMGTLLAVAAARYRRVMTPDKPPLPPFPTVLATWVLGVCIVLPYALYMHYIDFEVFLGPQFAGVGICTVNLEDDVTEYIHCLFIILLVKNMIDETEQNAAHFDLAFVTAVWVAFLPTITTPALYTAWRMGR
ncbi:cholecystokinin receptor type A-like [Eriocheir sinensis]|uniref:cholecystokinin receptor type A-like n=1 Tax=Eriocheir sinensis TaxID=95602 RepID=UPI0021C76260|nr:cholecystokinin receptor type A-like [Eriocheir sinensis]